MVEMLPCIFCLLMLGGAVALTLMNFILKASDGMQLYGINLSMKLIRTWSLFQ